MTLVERNKIDNIIKEYLLLDIRIKILKAKIKHYVDQACEMFGISGVYAEAKATRFRPGCYFKTKKQLGMAAELLIYKLG